MHLSFLGDSFVSDSIADAPDGIAYEALDFGRMHFDGVLRGIWFVLALVTPLALTVALNPAQTAPAEPVSSTHIHITHLSMP